MTDIPFAPFALPNVQAPPLAPEAAPAGKSRKKKAAATAIAPAVAASPAPPKPPRKAKAKAKPAARAPKFELQTILAVASTLKEDDMPLFEKMLGQLQDAGKPTRERVLAAVGKVFA